MAKRHHSSKHRSGMHRSGRLMREEDMGTMYRKTQTPKERWEKNDYSMLTEDHSAMANMPQGVKMTYFAHDTGHYLPLAYDDTLGGIDRQEREDNSQKMKFLKPRKA